MATNPLAKIKFQALLVFLLRHPGGIFSECREDHSGFPPECPFKIRFAKIRRLYQDWGFYLLYSK